jgi:hypothetical protein
MIRSRFASAVELAAAPDRLARCVGPFPSFVERLRGG